MSDDERKDDEQPEDDAALPDEEEGGLGLTEEFARIESEIQAEVGDGAPGVPEEPAAESEDAGDGDDDGGESEELEGPREVRFDETESTEWVAPVRASGETDEWAAAEAFEEAEDEGEEEVDPAGGEADPPQAEPAEDEPGPADEEEDEPEPADEAADESDADEADADEDDEQDEAPAPADAPAVEHTVVRPRPLTPRTPASVGSGAGGGPRRPAVAAVAVEDDKTPALWWRFLTGSILIVLATATAVAVNILLFFGDVAADLQPIPELGRVIDEIDPGDPQTILILGSDKRSNTPGDPGRSDTTMLLRVDAEKEVLSLFSLPRDLKVDIPGYGVGKLNEAYTVGGVKKTTKTVKELLDIEINHVVNVDFQGFADAVDAIDCVYVDVDRDYFNDNAGLFGDATYAAIDVNAGYQRLCGQNALDYVRYRHSDTDIVRAARQQDFLSQARRQVPVGEVIPILGGNLGSDLIDIFTEYTSSDISSTEEVLGTLKAFVGVRNVPIKRVSFEGDIGDATSTYVTTTPEQLEKAKQEFLGGEDTAGPVENEKAPKDSAKKDEKKEDKPEEDKQPETDDSSLVSTEDASIACGESQDKFAAFGRTSARRLKFPVYVPTAVVPSSCYSEGSRQYEIKDPEDNKNSAYKLVISYGSLEFLPEYYGVQGTTWADPPILEDPSDSIEIGDRTYDLYYDGDRLARIAWHDSENNSYWLSNTLLGTLDEGDMLAIAKSMDEAHS